jgi:phosphoribosylformylglycinamidine synthase
MTTVKALVLTGYGLNCDHETAHAFQLAGAKADRVHINALIDGSTSLSDYQILAFGGGFSWGDDHGAGVIQAVRLRTNIGDQLLDFVHQDKLVIGICNGFQTLVNLGLLPGFDGDYRDRSVALTFNDCGNFRNDWVSLSIEKDNPCVFTGDLDRMELPVRHGEGKFWAPQRVISRLEANRQVVMRYAKPDGRPAGDQFPYNPNGSINDIAGICDPTGRVFGLMPHPEAYHHWTNHPDWVRQRAASRNPKEIPQQDPTPGLKVFTNAVAFFA